MGSLPNMNLYVTNDVDDSTKQCRYNVKLVFGGLPESGSSAIRQSHITESNLGLLTGNHMLLKNLNSKDIACHLCRMIHGDERKTIYGCFECGKGYHVNCFTAYHNRNGLQGNNYAVQELVKQT